MTGLQRMIVESPPLRFIKDKTSAVTVPGTDGFSLWEVSVFFFKGLRDSRLNISCAAVTYNFLMAIPPTLLFLFSLIPYLPLRDVQETILSTLRLVTPNNEIYIKLSTLVVDFMSKERTGVLSFGLLLTLFYSSNGMMGLIRNFEKSLPFFVKRSGLKKRWTAIKLTFMLLGVAVLSLAVLILQTRALNGLILRVFDNTAVIRVVSLIIIVLIIFCAISVIYTYGPALSQRFKFVSPGSVFATILSVLTTTVFFFLVNHFIDYSEVYGSIGTLMAFMVWLWLNTMVILLGYELNVSIMLAKTSRKNVVAPKE